MVDALPTVVIGGYLGAGKTTLVNHLLRHAGGRRIAVLVNDFGDIAIDAELIDATSGDASAGVLSLSGGCLCCSFGDDLVGTLNGLAQRQPAPDLCLIELSGVALPAAVVRRARLALAVDIVGTLVLADASAIRAQASDRYVGDTVRQQLADADWLLLNKPDLLPGAALQSCTDWLAGMLPGARVMAAAANDLPAELVLGWQGELEAPEAADTMVAFAPHPIGPRKQPVSPFDSVSLALPDGIDLSALGRRLVDPALGVLRAKALARDAQGRGQLLQVAAGRWAVTAQPLRGAGRLVVIGLRERLVLASVQALVQALVQSLG